MKAREKTLLAIFLTLFAVIVGGGLLAFSLKSWFAIKSDTDTFRQRIASMKETIAQGEQWQERNDWLQSHAPSYATREEASSKLLDIVQASAQSAGLTLGGRELVKEAKTPEAETAPRFFNQASIRLTMTSVGERQLFTWLHSLQNPESFLGVTRLQITPAADAKTVNCEAQVTHFYREGTSTRLTNVEFPENP